MLDNLHNFLHDNSDTLARPLLPDILKEISIPQIHVCLDDSNFDSQAISYVCGYITKKIDVSNYASCLDSMTTKTVLPQHTLIMFKEYNNQKRLMYASQEFVVFLAKVYDIIYYILKNYGYCNDIQYNILQLIVANVDFKWFNCQIHKDTVTKEIIETSVALIKRKFCNDVNREFSNSKNTTAALHKVKHIF